MPVKFRKQAVEILWTLDQRLIRVAIVPDPDEDAKTVPLFQLPFGKHRHIDISELHQFCGVDVLPSKVETREVNVLVLGWSTGNQIFQAALFGFDDEDCQTCAK